GAEPASNFILERVQERVLGLQEDRRNLELLLIEEKRTLSYMLGFPADQILNLVPFENPEIFLAFKPKPVLEEQAIAASPELKQFDLLVQVADKMKKEVVFSFLGLSSLSRGVGGGVFDNLPIQDGLGFGTGASMRIVRTQKEILSVQKIAVAETLKRNLSNIISGWNLDVENHKNAKSRLGLAIDVFDGMKEKLRLGQYVESLDLMDASRNKMQAEIALVALRCRLAGYKDRLARVVFEGDYNRPPSLEKFEEKAKAKIKSEKKPKKDKV
ncbi:MAG: hypothetical protein K2X47_08020, partial [Bdellovibrionales bacterium]|nr:hypothetical protein [Bdellovibrionales bacterium]